MKSIKVLLLFALVACFVTRGVAVAVIINSSPRTAILDENSPTGTQVVSVAASDSDPSGGAFTFAIQNVNPAIAASYFTVSTIISTGFGTGAVTIASAPDREAAPAGVTFELVLMQSGAQGMVMVTVILRDVNDNPPIWNNDPGTPLSFNEDLPIGSLIRDLSVTDADTGVNGNVVFTLISPLAGPFSVGRISGLVTLTRSLDYETQPSVTITILAQDQGSPAMSATITLIVNVLDRLEPAPTFTQQVYSVSIAEGHYTSGQVLGSGVVRATDTEGATVTYRYRSSDIITDALFSVDATSGDVTVQGTLDREFSSIYSFGVDAYTVDTSDNIRSQIAVAYVVVTVTDVNDNIPTFRSSHYSSSVTEAAQPGHIVLSTINAFDLDEGNNAVFEYQKAASASGVPFSINPSSGAITVSGSLDYETTTSYSFTIVAMETLTSPMRAGSATVVINIMDENDNPPLFMEPSYDLMIREDQTGGAILRTITATDRDSGVFGDVTYALSGFGAGNLFGVSSSGQISLTGTLDREQRDTYFLTLIASDGGGTLANPNRAVTLLNITVLDFNDNPPVFILRNYQFNLVEGTAYPNILTLTATDADQPSTINSMISYSITWTNGSAVTTYFIIDGTTGAISAQNLDREVVDFFMLRITARDMGTTALEGYAFLNVTILDVNDHPPVFSPSTYSVTIAEDHAVGTAIGITISATDPEGHNVRYSIRSSATTDSALFRVEETSGMISLAQELNYDDPERYRSLSFTVQAVDDASPPRTGMAQVMVGVTNVNDNDPIISDPATTSVTLSRREDTPLQTLLTVTASDADGDTLVYTLTNSNFFTVDSSGVVTQSMTLDRETTDTHSFTVQVCDSDPTHCDSVSVTVSVTDFNDNAPVFVATSYSATISECSGPANSVLATVVAQDTMDIGANAMVVYEVVAGDVSRLSLDPNTGRISLTSQTVDYETGSPSYSLTIRARDNPSSTPKLTAANNATFTLTVTDCNDFPSVFTSTDHSFTISERSVAAAADEDVYTGISVMDQDGTAANRMVSYQLAGTLSSTNNWLNINSVTGNIFIPSGVIIDREDPFVHIDSLGRGVLTFNILAVNDAPTATFTSTASVTVRIMDINDNSPVIQQMGPIEREVVEHTQNGTQLAVISATDADYGDNSHIAYNIISGNTGNKFAIDSNRGIVYVNGDLDVERGVTSFTLTVRAENDLATGAAPDTITVVIMVTGTNDYSPEFTQNRYDATIMEYNALTGTTSLAAGTTVSQVVATDQDGMSDPAGQIEYAITAGNELGIFDIPNPASGTITVERPDSIDYETTSQFDLIVTATDLVFPENERRRNSTHMVITVVDVNDNIPIFLDNEYSGTVREGLPTGSIVTVSPTIRVFDADQDGNEPLTVEFVDGFPNLAFRITTDGRTVTTSTQLDREMYPTFNITLRVQDMASHDTRAYLIINIADFNDNPPQFSETPAQLAVRIPENLDVGEIVQIVNVTDADIDNNALVIFSMRGDRGYFDIDIHTGVITLIQSLDRETIHMYNLTIIATNPAPPTLNSSTTFVVTVENRNDNDPVFTMPVFVGNVTEEVPVNTSLNLYVHAEDLDPGSTIQYTLIPGTTTLFDVNPNTGQIYTTGRIDRETNNFQFFMVEANDTLIGSMKPSALVEVGVLDINDQSPVFENELYENDVYELTPANVIILIVTANDQDVGTNAEIEYTIDSVSPSSSTGSFGIDTNSGNIFPTQEVTLMSGDPRTINLTIRATDKGPGRNSGTVKVVLNIIDRNTEGPQFERQHYNLSVSENVNGIFGRVRANESSTDFGENARVIYSILPGDGSEMFHIDAMGNLHVNISLDRETRNLYTLLLAATDNATIPRTGFATVSVFVEDENDNDPYFDPSVYPISISESTEVGATVIRVLAFDDDIGTNGQLSLNITSGNTTVFQVNNDGIITTSAPLDREQVSQYTITITAVDMGVPVRSQTADVIITINDVNDNSPSFVDVIRDSEVYEDARSGHQLTTVLAMDPDYQLNGFLAYSFNNGSLLNGPFQIDPELGQIILQGTLDREEEDTYSLTVTAADQRGRGLNVRRTTAPFTVRVLDVNDNVPFFINSRYDLSVLENHPQEVTIGQVQADDNDIGSNAVLYYHLLGGSTTATVCDGVFCINPTTGGIYLRGELDRETEDLYILQAAVSNQLNLTFNGTSPENATTAPVAVMVEDVNDNPPQFISTSLRAAVAEEAEFGTTVTTIVATDLDIGSGQVVWFEFTTPQVPFLVDRDSGVVTTSGVFQGLSGTRYTVTIRAYDNKGVQPSLSTTTSLVVQVFKTSEQLILTYGCQKEDIEDNIDQIHSALASIIQARVEITQVRVKRTDDGTVDVTRSDVLFFVLDSITGDVIHPEVVLQLIDQSGVVALEQAAGCTVEGIRPHPVVDTGPVEVVPVWVWPIIALMAAVIAFVCCCFLCGLVVERRRNRRLKRRRGNDQYSQFTSQASDYNAVNNPLWVAPYDNWELASSTEPSGSQVDRPNPLYESQELTIEMFQDDDEDLPGSRENLVKAPPLTSSTPARESTYSGADDDELLAEAIGEERKGGFGYDSETSLI